MVALASTSSSTPVSSRQTHFTLPYAAMEQPSREHEHRVRCVLDEGHRTGDRFLRSAELLPACPVPPARRRTRQSLSRLVLRSCGQVSDRSPRRVPQVRGVLRSEEHVEALVVDLHLVHEDGVLHRAEVVEADAGGPAVVEGEGEDGSR